MGLHHSRSGRQRFQGGRRLADCDRDFTMLLERSRRFVDPGDQHCLDGDRDVLFQFRQSRSRVAGVFQPPT